MSHWYFATPPRNPLHFAPSLAFAAAALVLSRGRAHAAALEPIAVSAHMITAPSALAISSGRTQAVELKPITISAPIVSAPVVKTIGYGPTTNAPIQTTTVMARVKYNPVILTTHSGASLLKDDVADAARTECDSIDPLNVDQTCVRHAIKSAHSQVAAAITRARSTELKPITISAPTISAPVVKTIGYGLVTNAPIQTATVMARVKYNPVILTTHSGASLLKDDIADAARTECDSIDPLNGDGACVRRAIDSANSQVVAAITRARSTETG